VFFSKYHHLGNDFILIDAISQHVDLSAERAAFLCQRCLGVGADGIILLKRGVKHDFAMEIFNSDGSKPAFCGNGFFSLLKFIQDIGYKGDKHIVETPFSIVEGGYIGEKSYFILSGFKVLSERVSVDGRDFFHVNSGVPHAVCFVDDLRGVDVRGEGRKIRFHEKFAPEGVNVDFAFMDKCGVAVRTYERGVEDETFSCGSGAIAVALASKISKIDVLFKHGKIGAEVFGGDVKLLGKASFIFRGCL
jgi:diaminopimelate epimerase